MFVLIIDYGSGNIKSVYNSVKKTLHYFNKSSEVKVSNNLLEIEKADKIILPGVGSFDQCMNRISKIKDLVETLKNQVITKKKPFLGICVGMQILSSYGYEFEKFKGLNWIPGKVCKIDNHKLPHIGWNDIQIKKNSVLLNNLDVDYNFYFVNSFQFIPDNKENVISITNYQQDFCSIIQRENIFGVQFHPEKSQKAGQLLIKNFLDLN